MFIIRICLNVFTLKFFTDRIKKIKSVCSTNPNLILLIKKYISYVIAPVISTRTDKRMRKYLLYFIINKYTWFIVGAQPYFISFRDSYTHTKINCRYV